MKVLVACEHSGVVREAFRSLGHEAYSCDLLPADDDSPFHFQQDVFEVIDAHDWDLMIAHPPCTHLAVGARWFKFKQQEQVEALEFVRQLMNADIPKIAIENPVSVISSKIRKADQTIQPYHFGHLEMKRTCLWLKGLPILKHTTDLKAETYALPKKQRQRIHYLPPSADRWKLRSKTYPGIAQAMAEQWGGISQTTLGDF